MTEETFAADLMDRLYGDPTDPAAVSDNAVTLEIHICDQRRSYLATFSTEAQALAFCKPKSATHAFFTVPGSPLANGWENLEAWLYPTCVHGLSDALCAGPDHYPADSMAY
jgi:hypothetical protein